MLINRKKRLLISLLTVLSLFASAVSACACVHHQPDATEIESSCHSGANEDLDSKTKSETFLVRFDSDCSCIEKSPVYAIAAKFENKRTSCESHVADQQAAVSFIPVITSVSVEVETFYATSFSAYKHRFLTTLSPRAPPRL